MLSRYTIYRGRPKGKTEPVPEGIRQDARWRCKRHPLHPTEVMVKRYLAAPGEKGWQVFRRAYLAELEKRHRENPEPFDLLAGLARKQDVYIGCSCPTQSNPRVDRCHTWVALEFMKRKYPTLKVVFPRISS